MSDVRRVRLFDGSFVWRASVRVGGREVSADAATPSEAFGVLADLLAGELEGRVSAVGASPSERAEAEAIIDGFLSGGRAPFDGWHLLDNAGNDLLRELAKQLLARLSGVTLYPPRPLERGERTSGWSVPVLDPESPRPGSASR